MTDQDTSQTTTQSTQQDSEDFPCNSDDEEENSILLSNICRLEIENLRMRKSINNYGFNLKHRISELEHERRELIKAMKLLKPDEDPARFSVSENSKYVNVDFTQFADASSSKDIDSSGDENTSNSSNRRPFACQTQSFTYENKASSEASTSHSTDSVEDTEANTNSSQSQSQMQTPALALTLATSVDDDISVPETSTQIKTVRRNSLRRHPFFSKSTREMGSKNWDVGRDIEVGDTWQEASDNDSKSNQNGYDINIENKRQSTEIALSSMRLSMQNPIMENNIQQNFLEFYMIGVQRSILSGTKEPVLSQQQPSEILNRFPAENTVFMDSIADFAFPLGAYLHLTRSIAYARSILKKKPAQYHILQFSDAEGVPTFACCLTVTSVLRLRRSNAHHATVLSNLAPVLSRTQAREVLLKFFRHVLQVAQEQRRVVLNKDGLVVGYLRPRSLSAPMQPISPPASPAKSPLSFRKFTNSLFNRRRSSLNNDSSHNNTSSINNKSMNVDNTDKHVAISVSQSEHGITSTDLEARRVELSPKTGFARSISLSRDARQDDSEEVSETSDDDSFAATAVGARPDPSVSPYPSPNQRSGNHSPCAKKRGKIRRKKSKSSADDDSYYLISQRAYVLLSAKPVHTFLFRILEEIAQREEKCVLRKLTTSDELHEMEGEDDHKNEPILDTTSWDVGARDKFLKYVQTHSLENPPGYAVRGRKKDTLFFNFPSYISHQITIKINRISLDEWANAVLFSLLTPSLIMYLLNTLILEKSVIVCGCNMSLVSSLTSAIVNLLRPFTWEGVYIPIIPANAIEILEAPVPFVVGTNIPFDVQNISPAANVLYVDEILKWHMQEDASPADMMLAKCLHRSLDKTVKMPINQSLRNHLESIHSVLSRRLPPCFKISKQHDAKEAEIKILNLQLSYFFNEGNLSPDVRGAIKDVSLFLVQHNATFTGDISEHDCGWRKYGVYDPFTDAYNFFPQWFLDHQTSILEFQTALAQTQLFYSYVDRVKQLYTVREFYRRFIADFLTYKFILRKATQRKK